MSIIKSDQYNTDWQLKVLKGLQATVDVLSSGGAGATIPTNAVTPNMLISTNDDSIGVNVRSISIANIGTADGSLSVDGGNTFNILPKGVTVNLDAGGLFDYYPGGLFVWDATGTTYMITFNS
jgi:hypothetical protein